MSTSCTAAWSLHSLTVHSIIYSSTRTFSQIFIYSEQLFPITDTYVNCSWSIVYFAAVHSLLLLLNLWPVHVGVSLFISSFCLSCFFIVMFDYYKTIIWAASLMSCWLLWQPVAYYLCFIVFCSIPVTNKYDWLTDLRNSSVQRTSFFLQPAVSALRFCPADELVWLGVDDGCNFSWDTSFGSDWLLALRLKHQLYG